MRLEHITKFGRNFSIVCIPYSFKLLIQELQTINAQIRIITEDNIDQIESMSFSKNIQKLTDDNFATPKNLIRTIQERISEKQIKRAKIPVDEVETLVEEVDNVDSPQYEPNSPQYEPNSPQYDTNSPQYFPD